MKQDQYSTHLFAFHFCYFVLLARSDTGLIFRGKRLFVTFRLAMTATTVASSIKPSLSLAYSERESNLCLRRQLEKLDVFV
jgi:hypothetical protein